MNVLPIVMTMLMLLSIMTYARIESFRDLSGLKSQFEWYMQENERVYGNEVNDKKYNLQNPSKRKGGDDPAGKQKDEEKACSRVPFYLFLNKQQREAKHELYDQHRILAKLLLTRLYGDKDVFLRFEEQRPDYLDGLLDSLMNAAEKLPKRQSILSAADLGSVDLGDQFLNEVFTHMLRGTVNVDEQDVKATYPPLTGYITVKNKNKVRIFLAPHEVLMTIYDNDTLVKEIESTRLDLYKQVKDESLTKEEASKEFESLFSGKQQHGLDIKVLDFSVTKTNPKEYQ